jgi:DNA polymerase IIIc chi subunit
MPLNGAAAAQNKDYDSAKGTFVFAASGFVLTWVVIAFQQYLHQRSINKLRATINELQVNLNTLSARVDAIPFNDFTRQADRKIAEVRRYLDEDADRHRRTILRDIDGLRAETVRLAQELERRQLHLDTVCELVASVRDNNNHSFVEKLAETKEEVERSLGDLRNERFVLNQKIAQVMNNVNDINARIELQKNVIKDAEVVIDQVKKSAEIVHDKSQDVQKFVTGTLEEVTAARKTVSRAQNDFSNLNNEVKTVLRKMEDIALVAKNEKDSAEKQLRQVYSLLDDVRSRATTLATVTVQEENRVRELVDRSHRASGVASSPTSRSVVVTGQQILSDVFGISVGSDAAAYRSGYRKFTLKNHPDKGGNVASFQAVDGLYKLLSENNLFGAQSASSSVENDIALKLKEFEAAKSFIIK